MSRARTITGLAWCAPAKVAVTALPGTKSKVAALSTDMGTFGVLITVTSPTADAEQVVLLAKALK